MLSPSPSVGPQGSRLAFLTDRLNFGRGALQVHAWPPRASQLCQTGPFNLFGSYI